MTNNLAFLVYLCDTDLYWQMYAIRLRARYTQHIFDGMPGLVSRS